jgi:microcompartment protein CcmK/EutM
LVVEAAGAGVSNKLSSSPNKLVFLVAGLLGSAALESAVLVVTGAGVSNKLSSSPNKLELVLAFLVVAVAADLGAGVSNKFSCSPNRLLVDAAGAFGLGALEEVLLVDGSSNKLVSSPNNEALG